MCRSLCKVLAIIFWLSNDVGGGGDIKPGTIVCQNIIRRRLTYCPPYLVHGKSKPCWTDEGYKPESHRTWVINKYLYEVQQTHDVYCKVTKNSSRLKQVQTKNEFLQHIYSYDNLITHYLIERKTTKYQSGNHTVTHALTKPDFITELNTCHIYHSK